MKTGLVLEGGGMRGFFTVGVLDVLLENDIHFDYIIGVSAGAGHGASFASGQKGRGYRVVMDYVSDKRYLGLLPMKKEKSFFGLDFIYHTIPHELNLYDYKALQNAKTEFVTVVTDAESGEAVYFDKSGLLKNMDVLKASASLPVFSPPVEIDGKLYYDGGVADPIPVEKALADGCDRLVTVLTRPIGFQKTPERGRRGYSRVLRAYPQIVNRLNTRHKIYNQSLKKTEMLEKSGTAVRIAPREPLKISNFSRSREALQAGYDMGREMCLAALPQIRRLLCL